MLIRECDKFFMTNRPKPSAKNEPDEYASFENLLKRVVSVPHSAIKAALDSERAAKKKTKTSKSSASSRASIDRPN